MVQDVDNNVLDTSGTVTVTLSNPDALEPGFITGTIISDEPDAVAGNLACVADGNALESGKKIVSCVGQSPGDTTKMFNVLFVSKD